MKSGERKNLLASPHTNRDTPGRDRSPRTVTAAEKAQAHEVSLRRIGRLFGPYRWQLAIVTAIIVASSLVGLASPFLLRAVIDTALPDRNMRLLAWLVTGMVAVAAVTSAFGVVQTWISTKVGQFALLLGGDGPAHPGDLAGQEDGGRHDHERDE